MTIIGKDAVRASTQRVCAGPLTSYVDRFAAFLAGEGYAAQTLRTKCALIVRLSTGSSATVLRGWQDLTRSGSASFTPTVATYEGAAMYRLADSC